MEYIAKYYTIGFYIACIPKNVYVYSPRDEIILMYENV